MGFRPNPEKQDFIRLSLEKTPRPGGRSKAEARKYYGGVYHRLAPDARKQKVEELKAAQAVGKGMNNDLPAEDRVKVEGEVAGTAETVEDPPSAKDGVDESGATTESAPVGGPSALEAGEGDSASTTTTALLQPAEDSKVKPVESKDQHKDPLPTKSTQSDVQPVLVADNDDASSIAIEQHDETAQVDEQRDVAPQTSSSSASTGRVVDPAADEEDRVPEEKGEEREDVRADSVQPCLPQPPSPTIDATPREPDAALACTRQESQSASVQEDEQSAPAVASLSTEESAPSNRPKENIDDGDDDVALASLEQEIEKALDGEQDSSSTAANTAPVPPRENGEEVRDQDETDSLFVSEGEDEETEEGLLNGTRPTKGAQDILHLDEENGGDNTAQVPSPPEQDLAAEFSADEGDESDTDDLLGLQDSDNDDEDEANFRDSNADQQQDQEGLDFWPSSSNNYGAGASGSFLPDVMLPDVSPPALPGPTLNAPEVPSMSGSAAQNSNQTGSSDENERKRKLSDGLSSLAPEVRAAFLESTEGRGQGPSRWIGDLGTPDGPRQKKPRLNVRRPGQPGSTRPSPQEQQPTPPLSQPTAETLTTETSTAGTPETAAQEIPTVKPSFLSSILDDVKTKPQYPGAPH